MASMEKPQRKKCRVEAQKAVASSQEGDPDPGLVCLFYKYVPVEDVDAEISHHERAYIQDARCMQCLFCEQRLSLNGRDYLFDTELCKRLGLLGRVRIAAEGVNGTLKGSTAAIQEYEVARSHALWPATLAV